METSARAAQPCKASWLTAKTAAECMPSVATRVQRWSAWPCVHQSATGPAGPAPGPKFAIADGVHGAVAVEVQHVLRPRSQLRVVTDHHDRLALGGAAEQLDDTSMAAVGSSDTTYFGCWNNARNSHTI